MTKGTRVRLSEEGYTVFSRRAPLTRQATVVGLSRDATCVWVIWDGTKSRELLAKVFLEEVPIEKT